MSKFLDSLSSFFRINKNVIKGEINEIKELKVTDEDKAQGKAAAVLAVAALAACGVPIGALGQPVLEKVFAYVIRDAKDGAVTPEKLILGRIIEEVKKEKQQGKIKTPEDELYNNLNK